LVDAARTRLDTERPGAALCGVLELLVTEAGPEKDLVDALTGAGVDVRTRLSATATELRTQLHLLTRAQRAHDVRAEVTVADLLALISGVLHSQHVAGQPDTADPAGCSRSSRDGMRAAPH